MPTDSDVRDFFIRFHLEQAQLGHLQDANLLADLLIGLLEADTLTPLARKVLADLLRGDGGFLRPLYQGCPGRPPTDWRVTWDIETAVFVAYNSKLKKCEAGDGTADERKKSLADAIADVAEHLHMSESKVKRAYVEIRNAHAKAAEADEP